MFWAVPFSSELVWDEKYSDGGEDDLLNFDPYAEGVSLLAIDHGDSENASVEPDSSSDDNAKLVSSSSDDLSCMSESDDNL